VVPASNFNDLAGNVGFDLQQKVSAVLIVGAENQHVDAFLPHHVDNFGRQPVVGDVMGNLHAGLPGAADQLSERSFQPGRP
jgi:hypothetical protein